MLRRLQFNLWYFFHPPWDSGVSPPELLDFIGQHPPRRAIDLGCGSGTNVITLAEHGWETTGIDFAPRAIQIARRKAQRAGVHVTLSVGDVTRLNEIDGKFELALDLGCFHGLRTRDTYLKGLRRILAPGGYWLMYGFFRDAAAQTGPGLDTPALNLIQANGFLLRSRTDGVGKWGRPSAWFLHQLPAS